MVCLASGGKGIRTPDIQLAKLALYQLSYTPESHAPENQGQPASVRPAPRGRRTEQWAPLPPKKPGETEPIRCDVREKTGRRVPPVIRVTDRGCQTS